MKKFEQDGIWFLPETPDRKICGRLTFSPDKIPELNLFGELKDLEIQDKNSKNLEFPIINGYFIGEKGSSPKVTLFNCTQIIRFSTGIQTSKIYVRYILEGHHFESEEEALFNCMIVNFDFLREWIHSPKLQIKCIPRDDKARIYQEIHIKQIVSEPLELGELLNSSITLLDKATFDSQQIEFARAFGWNEHEVSLKDRKEIGIKTKENVNFKKFLEVIESIQDFLTFASGQVIYANKIESYMLVQEDKITNDSFFRATEILYSEEKTSNDKQEELSKSKIELEKEEKPIRINFFYRICSLKSQDRDFNADRVLFYFNDIKEKSSRILKQWELNQENLRSIIEMYLRLVYIPHHHINNFFLSLAQAIEGFHRIHHSGQYCERGVFENIKETLKQTFASELKRCNVQESHHESLLKKINYWNEFSLKERLEDLLNKHDYTQCLPDDFFTDGEQDIFVKQVRDTRGSLTHPDTTSIQSKKKKRSKYIVSGNDLENLTYKLKILLEICLIKQLGLHSSEVKSIIEKKYRNKY